ncbi:MAG: hypothetical protein B6U95_00765 [Thermofilum sp. ex4484_82]|nr:MAG: hypothetical protein B6U95_00765 [Thermofilum sp. ex4484_82]OYT39938.1 MAG: hypothetical protein B6U96_00775 [Archaeoglobales archaeon ex4484_92]
MKELLEYTKKILRKYRVYPKKRLSQHFLVDKKILDIIVNSLELKNNEIVLEIGAGIGTVTRVIAERCLKVLAVEIDKRLVELLFKLLDEPYYDFAVMSFQKEFVDRLRAKPGTKAYGRLTVSFQSRARMEVLTFISRKCFYPEPDVDAVLIKIKPLKSPCIDTKLIDDILRFMFSRRRKNIGKVLREYIMLKYPSIDFEKILSEVGINSRLRVYQLTPEDFINIVNTLRKLEI